MTNRTPKRWYQFSLRSLLILVTLAALVCSYVGVHLRRYYRQEAALAEIRESGGWVVYYYELDANGNLPNMAPPDSLARTFARKRDRFFGRVFGVYFMEDDLGPTDASDRLLASASQFPDLRELHATSSKTVTDDGLVHLSKLNGLGVLDLDFTAVGDQGLVHTSHLPELRELRLMYTAVTDAGLLSLEKMSELRYLDLSATDVTKAGVERLQAALPNCRILAPTFNDPFLEDEASTP